MVCYFIFILQQFAQIEFEEIKKNMQGTNIY